MRIRILALCGALLTAHAAVVLAQPPALKKAKAKAAQPLAVALPEGTRVEKDVPYIANGHERQKLDLYLPPGEGTKRPVLVWVHGGGWRQGSKDRTPALPVVSQGTAVVSINYRLSEHATFPAQIQDCQAAIRWLRGNAAKYGLDPDRIGVWGASAGGHLVALLGTASDTDAWEAIGEHRDQSAKVKCVIDWFGPADFSLFGEVVAQSDTPIGKLFGPIDDAKTQYRRASPVIYVTKDDPPFLIMHGTEDRLVPLKQSERLRDELKANDVPVELAVLDGSGHGGPAFLDETSRGKIREFLQKNLHGAK
jgi:acetyl esterase/lipase